MWATTIGARVYAYAEAVRERSVGVAHMRLRVAAGCMSGEGKRQVVGLPRWRRSGCGIGGLGHDQAERQAVLDLQHVDATVTDLDQ